MAQVRALDVVADTQILPIERPRGSALGRFARKKPLGAAGGILVLLLVGTAVLADVLSTHDPDHALMVATRVAVIADGGLRAIGRPAEVVTAETLSAIYRTEVRVEQTPSGHRVCVPAWDVSPS